MEDVEDTVSPDTLSQAQIFTDAVTGNDYPGRSR